jgi:hypothetical protein
LSREKNKKNLLRMSLNIMEYNGIQSNIDRLSPKVSQYIPKYPKVSQGILLKVYDRLVKVYAQ